MALPEIEFELSSHQYEQMGYPGLRQGQSLWPVLDAGILLPDLAADDWFAVQKEPLPPRLVRIGPALYAFTGQIGKADLHKDDDEETGVLLVDTGVAPLRVTCAPETDGRLPFGTWETRYLSGVRPSAGHRGRGVLVVGRPDRGRHLVELPAPGPGARRRPVRPVARNRRSAAAAIRV